MRRWTGYVMVMSLALSACAESAHQRERMGVTTHPTPVFAEPSVAEPMRALHGMPASLTDLPTRPGEVVSLSGIVLKAKRLEGMTEIEILHLPTGADGRPSEDRRQSQGRFLARQGTFLDPAIFATRPMVTVEGLIEGTVERPLEPGADEYAYPLVTIQSLTIWPPELLHASPSPYQGHGGAASLSQGGTGFDLLLDLFSVGVRSLGGLFLNPHRQSYGSSSPAYSPPPAAPSSSPSPDPKDIPPQFRKNRH